MKLDPTHDMTKKECIPGVKAALERARKRAREIAYRTGTPLVVAVDGKVEKRMLSAEDVEK